MSWNGKLPYGLFICFIFYSFCGISQSTFPKKQNIDVVPKVQQIKVQKGFFELTDTVGFSPTDFSLEAMMALTDFFSQELDDDETAKKSEVFFHVEKSKFERPNTYSLVVKADSIILKSNTKEGLFAGISTIKQLLLLNQVNGKYYIPQLEILDWPKFQHRGLLLDCSRHFFDKSVVKKYIDLLALYKMNVLHWHLTEDQAWRIVIDQYPKLERIGSIRTEVDGSEYGGIYTKADIREIVEYAKRNGIEVIPEIELPGHSQAAIAAYPELSCTGKQVEVANDWGVFKEIYCAGNDSVFTFLEHVLTEVIELFPSKYIHIGGDEAPKSRWEECAKCQQRIKTEGLKNEHELQSYFIKRIQKFLYSHGKEIIGWDEILEGGLAEGAVVQSWRGFEGGIAAAKNKHKVIMSPTSHAYLDYDLKAINLEKVYNFNPIPKELEPEFHSYVIGGECNMWTEHVTDEAALDYKVFPRMLAMAEVLWNDADKKYEEFNERIQSQYSILDHYQVKYGEESFPFSYNSFLKEDSLFVELIPADKNLKLTYQFTHGIRTNAIDYTKPFAIGANKSVHVQAFKNDKPYFCVIEFPMAYHKALGVDVNYNSEYSKWYTAGGKKGLVDGKLGTYDFRDGNWQGFWGNDAEIILDLKANQETTGIAINFYQYNNSWIFIPKEIQVEYTLDGKIWKRFGSSISETDPKKRGKFIETIEIKNIGNVLNLKSIRIKVKNLGEVPEWHEAAGSDAWIFMDEIQIH